MYVSSRFEIDRITEPFRFLSREISLSWAFIRSDFSCTILSASIFMLIALNHSPSSTLMQGVGQLSAGVLYFWLYIYQFCLPTQIFGLAEDQLNKSERPLPQGLLTLRGAKVRWLISTLFFYLAGWMLGVLLYALIWNAVTFYLIWGGDKHWFGKNAIAMGLGTFAQLMPAWLIMAPITPAVQTWIIIISLWVGITASTQDFRDVAGDNQVGRKTMPIVFGTGQAKIIMSLIWVTMAVLISLAFVAMMGHVTPITLIGASVLFASHLLVAYRLLVNNTPQFDHETYTIHTYLYCGILLSMIFFV